MKVRLQDELSTFPAAMSDPRTTSSSEIVTSAQDISAGPISFFMLIVALVEGLSLPLPIFDPASNSKAST